MVKQSNKQLTKARNDLRKHIDELYEHDIETDKYLIKELIEKVNQQKESSFIKPCSFILLNTGIIVIILSLLIIQTCHASWLSYFNILLGILSLNFSWYLLAHENP